MFPIFGLVYPAAFARWFSPLLSSGVRCSRPEVGSPQPVSAVLGVDRQSLSLVVLFRCVIKVPSSPDQ